MRHELVAKSVIFFFKCIFIIIFNNNNNNTPQIPGMGEWEGGESIS